jgi:hypothetical protein
LDRVPRSNCTIESLLDTLTALGPVEQTDAGTYAG